jgi:hypothetical protein
MTFSALSSDTASAPSRTSLSKVNVWFRTLASGLNYVHHMRIAASATEAAKFFASLS